MSSRYSVADAVVALAVVAAAALLGAPFFIAMAVIFFR
jgi:hypothetical protein